MTIVFDKLYRLIGRIWYSRPSLRRYMPDKMYLQCIWRDQLPNSGELNLRNPMSYNEKLNWLKLYYHNPLLHTLVDKCEVKKYVASRIGDECVVKTYGVYESFDEIDFDKLPNQFVLKCTHDSGSIVVCRDKSSFNYESARVLLDKGLSVTDYYETYKEWAYKGVKPRIIAEEYIDCLGKPDSLEYKFTCLNGKVRLMTLCSGIAHVEYSKRFNDHFDRDFYRVPFYASYKPAGKVLEPSDMVSKMIEICEKLAEGLPQVRVDLYENNGRVLFGEMTFYTWGGYIQFEPKEFDLGLGAFWELPAKKWK